MTEHIHECGIEASHKTCTCVICGEQYPNRESAEPSKPAAQESMNARELQSAAEFANANTFPRGSLHSTAELMVAYASERVAQLQQEMAEAIGKLELLNSFYASDAEETEDENLARATKQLIEAQAQLAQQKETYAALWKDRDEQEYLRAEYFRKWQAAEERVAQLEKQHEMDAHDWDDDLTGMQIRAEAAEEQVKGLRAALQRIMQATPHSMCHDAEAWVKAEAALATQLPTAPQEKP